MFEDTIIALATPPGRGGLGLVRLSGGNALATASRFFKPAGKRRKIPPFRPILGSLCDAESGDPYEEALLTYFQAPRSYTTEDMVEISCHGSPVLLEETIRQGLRSGARHAEPGEFTLRAFLGGRLDLVQAEAVNDLIQAASLDQARIAFRQLEGRLSLRLNELREQLIRILAEVEAGIEFPGEELAIPRPEILAGLEKAGERVETLVKSYDIGKTLSDGILLAITGRTNAGKSTLFNALLERDRAIVTPEPGTTRDYLQENLQIKNTRFSLIDTAGLDRPSGEAEREGMRRSREVSGSADGVLLVFDASRPETETDCLLARQAADQPALFVFNKSDLPRRINRECIRKAGGGRPAVDVSALRGTHLAELKARLIDQFAKPIESDRDIILHLRQKLLLESIGRALSGALNAARAGSPDEILAEELRAALEPAGRLMGEIRSDEVLENIFQRFCIGK
jgi:tRNA modification GTPase